MINSILFLANLFSAGGPFGDFDPHAPGMVAAGAVFLFLVVTGVTACIFVFRREIKQPADWNELKEQTAARALPLLQMLSLIPFLAIFFYAALFVYKHFYSNQSPGPEAILIQAGVLHIPFLISVFIALRLFGKSAAGVFGIGANKLKMICTGVLIYLAILPLIWIFSVVYQLILYFCGQEIFLQDVTAILAADATWPVRVALFVSAIIIAPVFEEIVFRGLLLPAAVRHAGLWPGVIILSLLFGALHWHLPSFGALVLLSALLSFAYIRTGSILVPITIHAVFNGVTVLLLMIIS